MFTEMSIIYPTLVRVHFTHYMLEKGALLNNNLVILDL